jgi:hypothetical protein
MSLQPSDPAQFLDLLGDPRLKAAIEFRDLDADLPRRQKCGHSLRIAGPMECAGDDDPVLAGEYPGEALAVTVRQQLPQPFPPAPHAFVIILSCSVPAWPA